MTKLTSVERERIVARVIDDMKAMPKAVAALQASSLYSETELRAVKDPLLKQELCRSLASYFDGTTARGLDYWRTFV